MLQPLRAGVCVTLLAVPLAACGPSASPEGEATGETSPPEATPEPTEPPPAGPTPLPVPEQGIQVKTSGTVVQPGEDITWCTYLNGVLTEPIAVNGSLAQQAPHGHHISIYEANGYIPDGGAPCYGMDTLGWSLISGNFSGANKVSYPEDTGVRVDPENTLVFDAHYVNTSDEPIVMEDVINLFTLPLEEVEYFVGSYQMVNFDIAVEPGAAYSTQASCPIPFDLKVVLQIGHQHEFGTRFVIDRVQPGGARTTLYDGLPMIDDPTVSGSVTYFDAPLPLSKGDAIEWRCEWFNSGDTLLTWPSEMCVVLLTYYPEPESQLVCPRNVESAPI